MNRPAFFIVLSCAVTLFSVLQAGCANPQPTTSTTANVATPEPTPDKAAIEAELMKIENDWPRVMKERDGATVRKIDADDAYLLSWDGSVATKEKDAKDIESGNMSDVSVEMGDLNVKIIDIDAAVVTGKITIQSPKQKGAGSIDGQYRFVDTFARQNGQWKVISSATVKISAAITATSPTPKSSAATTPSPAMKASPTTKPSPAMRPSPQTRPSAPKPSPTMKPAAPVNMKTP